MQLIKTLTLVIIFSLLAVSVYAAGSSTRSTQTTQATDTEVNTAAETIEETSEAETSNTVQANKEPLEQCEDLNERKERIACRLKVLREKGSDYVEKYNEKSQRYEACERLAIASGVEITSKEECLALYKKVGQCYDLQGKDKLYCFKTHNRLLNKYFKDADKKDIRNYIVTLLYELQERIENALEEGKIADEEKAAEAIDLIVEIKEGIMNGEGKNIIKPKIKELKLLIKELKNE